jgi:UDP-glucose 4-epimerase
MNSGGERVFLEQKRVLVTGGTGSLGKTVVRRILGGELGRPEKVIVFSRDEAKQHDMRLSFLQRTAATDDIIYRNSQELLMFRIGDVRDSAAIVDAVRDVDVIIHSAALKQVPTCEYFPAEAVNTNILGAQNLVRAIRERKGAVEVVVGVSTDKACKPINVMGMTKALMERTLVQANLECPDTRHVCVRYGNVIASRGSVVPLFLDQVAHGGPLTITLKEMTRFLLTLDKAVDTVFAALRSAGRGDTYVPKVPAARVVDMAEVLINGRDIRIEYTGIRPGEKIHEIMVSEEERHRTIDRDGYYVIRPALPELRDDVIDKPPLRGEYSSSDVTLDLPGLRQLLGNYLGPRAAVDATA